MASARLSALTGERALVHARTDQPVVRCELHGRVSTMVRNHNQHHSASRGARLAVFLDLDSFATEDGRLPHDFDVQAIVTDLRERGSIAQARAYADWTEFPRAGEQLARAGFELVQVFPMRGGCGSSIPVTAASDALGLVLADAAVDLVVFVADQVDFSGAARRLRERGLRVLGVGLSPENASMTLCFDEFDMPGRGRERGGRGWGRRPDDGTGGRMEQLRRNACEFVCSTLARLEREGRETVSGDSLLAELRRFDAQFDPVGLGFGGLTGLLRSVRARFEERSPAAGAAGEEGAAGSDGIVIYTTLQFETAGGVSGADVPADPEEYQTLLSRLQLRVTPVEWRRKVVERIYGVIQAACAEDRPITAGGIEAQLVEESAGDGGEEWANAVRDTLRVLFVNRAFRLESVDDGYDSALTFNKLYIRTADDLQQYYAEAILCAIKNMIRERGGGRPDIAVLAELILGGRDAAAELETIEAQLQGADRPFKKPPRYSGRWTSPPPLAETTGGSVAEGSAGVGSSSTDP